jgi:molybdate transport system regulatory protein
MPTKRQATVTPRVKLWLEKDGRYVFGFGISNILEAVERTGSIKEAAASLSKSYRHVWSRVKEAEAALGIQLVETRVGGEGRHRSQLTQQAKMLAEQYGQLRHEVKEMVEQQFAARLAHLVRSVLADKRRSK